MNLLLEPLTFEFMRNALSMGVLLGVLCAVVGSYMIVQQMGMMGDMIAHSVMAGLPVAVFMGLPLSIGALVAGVVSAVILAGIEATSKLKPDALMALMLALAVMLARLRGRGQGRAATDGAGPPRHSSSA